MLDFMRYPVYSITVIEILLFVRMNMKRVFLIVLDSVGIGEMPDAAEYGDAGSNTLRAAAASPYFSMPNMAKLGFFNIDGVTVGEKAGRPAAAFARMAEQSKGKDTTIGHWEIAGLISRRPLPTYPNGFPQDVIRSLKREPVGVCSATVPIPGQRS